MADRYIEVFVSASWSRAVCGSQRKGLGSRDGSKREELIPDMQIYPAAHGKAVRRRDPQHLVHRGDSLYWGSVHPLQHQQGGRARAAAKRRASIRKEEFQDQRHSALLDEHPHDRGAAERNLWGERCAKMVETRDKECRTGKMGDAWDVANADLFLAYDEANYVTGAEIVVDGGITCEFV